MHIKDANGNWNRRKNNDTHVCVAIDGDIRQTDGYCTEVQGNPTHADGCDKNTNRKSKAVSFSGVRNFHYIHVVHATWINGGVTGQFDQ